MVAGCDTSLIKNKVYDVNSFPYRKFYYTPILKQKRSRKKISYLNSLMTLDIETTKLEDIEQSICYIWQICLNNVCIIGRTLIELKKFLDRLTKTLDSNTYLVCYIHNESFEFHHLREVLQFDRVFSTAKRKPIRSYYKQIEFRCSYILTNSSLDSFLKKMNVKALKTSMDYNIKRYPWTKLNKEDTQYCLHDVIGLYEGIKKLLAGEKDDLYTVPMTSTGYTRRDVKKAYFKTAKRSKLFQESIPTFEIFQELQEAFRGGNTHANRWIAGKLLDSADYGLLHSYDRVSSYPDVLLKNKYPWKFEKSQISLDEALAKGKACLFRAKMSNVQLADKFDGCPYIPLSKTGNLSSDRIEDNGRILEADHLEITLTDIDYKIIKDTYNFDLEYEDLYISDYAPLPTEIKDVILKYYRGKTGLKGVEGSEEEYMKIKNRFNAIYGLMVQSPAKQLIDYDTEAGFEDDIFKFSEEKTIQEIYENNKEKLFLLYQWGVWCTAYARSELQEMINIVQKSENATFCYCDTDSVKFFGEADFSEYNNRHIMKSIECGAAADDIKGKKHYIGIAEKESDMKKFITHGAKKYAYTDTDDKLHLTCAGVNKKLGVEELNDIKWFKDGFIFGIAGGLEAKYNDFPKIRHYKVGKHQLYIYSNIYLKESTYTVSKTPKYKQLIDRLTHLEL